MIVMHVQHRITSPFFQAEMYKFYIVLLLILVRYPSHITYLLNPMAQIGKIDLGQRALAQVSTSKTHVTVTQIWFGGPESAATWDMIDHIT